MEGGNTIREVLHTYLQKNNLSYVKFHQISGVNTGTLSRLIQGSKPISLRQLEQITRGMELPEDALFDLYVEECIEFSITFRRIEPFILRCAELDRLDCLERLVGRLLDKLRNVHLLFVVAEKLFDLNHTEAAALLYSSVSEAERYQHSERLAICRYRLFQISLSNNVEDNLRAADVFGHYVNRLEESYQVEALRELINVMMTGGKWKQVDQLAEQMLRVACIQYERPSGERQPKEPYYSYILYGWLMRGTVSAELKDFEGAMQYVSLYANGEACIHERDEVALWYIQQFNEWAMANTLLYRLLSGEVAVLEEYADFVAERPEEVSVALGHIMKTANRFNFEIDHILERFSAHIPFQVVQKKRLYYKSPILAERQAQFFAELGKYKSKKNPATAIKIFLTGLELSVKINSVQNIANYMTLFELHREWATVEEKGQFRQLAREVDRLNAED
ncbi:hypothetical protein [Paenibacillus massiliensis]|uniref:hypothetical protein n=2 Tax=Paenibacillus massiliensis TaxID=225917 RepID=UPI00036E97B3|nr:hypothetical protein [Paenibacillus massiliensis]